MPKVIIDEKGNRDFCDLCGEKSTVFTVKCHPSKATEENLPNYFCDLCENCMMSMGRAIRRRAVNKILEIKGRK
jgi:hypothetical protein